MTVIHIDSHKNSAHNHPIAINSGDTGLATRLWSGGRPPCGLFCVRTRLRVPFMGGPGGETFGSAGFSNRFANPATAPPLPFGDGGAVLETHWRAIMNHATHTTHRVPKLRLVVDNTQAGIEREKRLALCSQLDQLCDMAYAGKIIAIAYSAVYQDGDVDIAKIGCADPHSKALAESSADLADHFARIAGLGDSVG